MDKVNVDLAAAGWHLKNATICRVIAEAVEREQPEHFAQLLFASGSLPTVWLRKSVTFTMSPKLK
ncbi:DNA polymerase III subunit theta [Escherichia coli]